MYADESAPDSAADAAAPAAVREELERRITEGKLELPLLPGVAMDVTAAAAREDGDARALAEILKRDPALAAHVLRVVNSPVYSPRAQIVSLQQAVARMGAVKIREIALIVACRAGVFNVKGYETELSEVFRHSVATALFAQEIARQTRNNVEDAFLCGLLHDVGRPVLLQALVSLERDQRAQGEQRAALKRPTILTLVSEAHATAGAALAKSWKLPEAVYRAIQNHHELGAGPDPAAVRITALADTLAHATLDAPELDPKAASDHPSLVELEIYPDVLTKILARAQSVRATTEVLS
jgi:putative nucleotidyltransferase with HDIG domain